MKVGRYKNKRYLPCHHLTDFFLPVMPKGSPLKLDQLSDTAHYGAIQILELRQRKLRPMAAKAF